MLSTVVFSALRNELTATRPSGTLGQDWAVTRFPKNIAAMYGFDLIDRGEVGSGGKLGRVHRFKDSIRMGQGSPPEKVARAIRCLTGAEA